MPEPTIDDLLKWLDDVHTHLATLGSHLPSSRETMAIRAILEQHRTCQAHIRDKDNYIAQLEREGVASELEAIRAFVERVTKRWEEAGTPYASAMLEELAALEGEACR